MSDYTIEEVMDVVRDNLYDYGQLKDSISNYIRDYPELQKGVPRHIHSVKSRLKDVDHIQEKILRKMEKDNIIITPGNVLDLITDIAGVRVLHLIQSSFSEIFKVITRKVENGDWIFAESPKVYTWDKEAEGFFSGFGLKIEFKETYYTSVHFLIKERETSKICCELQVRTLFEEIWGEIDHTINYPVKTDSLACREQLRVLSKLIATGSRLSEAIFNTHSDFVDSGSASKNVLVEASGH